VLKAVLDRKRRERNELLCKPHEPRTTRSEDTRTEDTRSGEMPQPMGAPLLPADFCVSSTASTDAHAAGAAAHAPLQMSRRSR
jgi:hypothetical protein